jgi:hypothetical protein
MGGAGIQTAALSFGGSPPRTRSATEFIMEHLDNCSGTFFKY